jgi:hypothetical protein
VPSFPRTPFFAGSALPPLRSGQVFLDETEHFLHNRSASVATLRKLFAFGPECRSRSLRNQRSPSPESSSWEEQTVNLARMTVDYRRTAARSTHPAKPNYDRQTVSAGVELSARRLGMEVCTGRRVAAHLDSHLPDDQSIRNVMCHRLAANFRMPRDPTAATRFAVTSRLPGSNPVQILKMCLVRLMLRAEAVAFSILGTALDRITPPPHASQNSSVFAARQLERHAVQPLLWLNPKLLRQRRGDIHGAGRV